MKKTIIISLLAIISIGCVAQKNNVRKAENLALSETPDYAGARAAIKEALANDETKDQAKTWYVAGLIGYQQNETEYYKLQLGKGGQDYVLRGTAVLESYNYWLRADEIAMTPVYDKKGKAKYDTGTRKKIAEKMVVYYERQELINYAYDLCDKKEYAKAYEAFKAYTSIPDLPMMQDKNLQARMPKDTIYEAYLFNTGWAAYNAQMYNEAIETFRSMMDKNIRPVVSAQFIYQSYINLNDSTAANNLLDDCIKRFPNEAWFMQNRINNLVNEGKMDQALVYLDQALANDEQIQYLQLKASIFDMQKRYEDAIAVYDHALQLDPDNADLWYNYGVIYVEIGNDLNDKASYLGAKEYKLARMEIEENFKKALPYFEKAYQLQPDNFTYKRQLRSLYYRLGMTDKYNELSD